MPVTCVFGMQWGDEGKGRIVDLLSAQHDVVVRYQGGANAGHTVVVGTERYVLHLLPSGVIHPTTTNVIGNGVVVDPWGLLQEIEEIAARGVHLEGRLLLSDRAHVVMPYHRSVDRALEVLRGGSALGTTSRGIGPTYGDKYMREGFRVADLLRPDRFTERLRAQVVARNAILEKAGVETLSPEDVVESTRAVAERLKPWVADTTDYLLRAWKEGKRILIEGAQAFGLDVDHGSYPYVTSSHTGADGISSGTGLPPRALDHVLGIVKAYTTRVGGGPFPTRETGPAGKHLSSRGREVGSTTGRVRDCGWFDTVVARRAAATQGVDAVALMKLDVLSGLSEIKLCTSYELAGRRLHAPPAHADDWEACRPVYETFEGWTDDLRGARHFQDLPGAAQRYVRRVQDVLQVRIEMVSVGAERDQFIGTSRGIPVPV